MGLLNNILGSSVPGGSLAKPLGIALLAYLASRSGNNPAATGGGFGGLLSGGLGGLLGGLLGAAERAWARPPCRPMRTRRTRR
jgi:hypothetical protein